MKTPYKISFIIVLLTTFLFAKAYAAEAITHPPLFTVINNTGEPLALVCGTQSKPAYIQHFFPVTNHAPNETAKNTLQINKELFLNGTEPVTCSIFKVKNMTPAPHDFSLLFGFLLIPEQVGDRIKVKSYIEQNTTFEIVPEFNLAANTGTLTLTLTKIKKPQGNKAPPSEIAPFKF